MTLRSLPAAALAALLLPALCPAADDPNPPELPVRDGLELWLDVSRLEGPKLGTPEMLEGVAIDAWPDASGQGRAVRQENTAARPKLLQIGESKVVRFDGEDDHLRAAGLGRSLDAATILLVVAPRANPGEFRGILATNAKGRRDYETGFTIDQGPGATPAFASLNVEGHGFQGAANLMQAVSPFGTLHVVEAAVSPAEKTVRVTLDGKPQGTRPFIPGPVSFDELTVGARFYTNGPGDQQVRGPASTDIAEVLVYGRELSADETAKVRAYLDAKHAKLRESLAAGIDLAGGKPLESIADPPPVQMFVPGFTARELPVDLPNINNVRYRPDGKLVALAYDGDVYLLSDTDGDGIEDKADLFWDNPGRVRAPIGMALTPPGYRLGQGLFFPTKSECLLVTDTDGDDKADKETVVAAGWQETFHGVDAVGVAVDPKDQSVYFGIGTGNFTDPWQKDKEGKSTYRLDGERAAILRVAPDFSTREVVSTGIRFPIGIAFNHAGDLFCTDQEGATWVPNGNPFDELLHVRKGRHYGFPPRHPKLTPDVTDEPSTYDYTPQHQSTCGLIFNEPVGDGPIFGPGFWAHDALVCGYSRGKVWRTKLAETPAGYVADNRLIASLDMLTVDSCVGPAGELVVAVHSGGPDWGSGPSGRGKLYKVRYADKSAPQPVATWAASPTEVRIAFDRPLDPEKLRGLTRDAEITYGAAVRAGDEFEVLRPGYAVVAAQVASVRRDLPVRSVQLSSDGRTLLLATDPHPSAVWYAVRLPGLGRPSEEELTNAGDLPQLLRIDLDYSLGGVEASWEGDGPAWTGWLPHLDLAASRTFTQASAEHDALWPLLEKKGRLRLRTQIDLTHMLRARVQPGSELDYQLTPEQVTVTFAAPRPFTLKSPAGETAAKADGDTFVASFARETITGAEPVPVEIDLETGGDPQLAVSWTTAESDLPRPLVTARLLLPWAKAKQEESLVEAERTIPELEGGSWARGRAVFYGEVALCGRCHAVHGKGGTIGPDLSNLVHRDYASVLRDVENPNYAVNPDFVAHTLVLKDGRVLAGVVRGDADRLIVGDTEGRTAEVARDDVEEIAPSTKSVMPEGILKRLGPESTRDLLTFLLMRPPHLPTDGAGPVPAPRTRDELRSVLAGAPDPPEPARPIKVILVAGRKDHGPGEHDYPAWQKAWSELLSAGDGVSASQAWDWPSADDLAAADVIVFYQQGTWTPERARDIDAFLARGGGLVYIHYAVDGGQDAPGFARRIGLAWGGGAKFRHGPLELGFQTGSGHPIARNFDRVKFVDESYWQLTGDPAKVRVLATAVEDDTPQPLFWTLEPQNGRVFVSIPGHYSWTFDDPLFRVLLLRGFAWAAKEPVDRFNDLVTPGARITD